MPLNFGKRTGGYKLNRDLYVISVHLLDGSCLQCTLSTKSTGEDCMNYICQKLELQQKIYFGLRYKSIRMVYRWIDLHKPLKKQLTKNAHELRLYFSVMFHTPRADLLTDETARYYYYLQMRADILDCRLFGSPEKAILCASYSLQVEFGDYDLNKQTAEVLKSFTLLPPHITKSAQILEGFVKQVILGHEKLKGLPQSQAELAYIYEAQGFDGYGVEYFPGLDEDGEDIFVGYCMNGIIVKRLQGAPVVYSWKEVQSISAQKSKKFNLVVNCAELNRVHFQMEDLDTAKYTAYICGLQLKFYKEFLSSSLTTNLNLNMESVSQVIRQPSIQMQTIYNDVQNGDSIERCHSFRNQQFAHHLTDGPNGSTDTQVYNVAYHSPTSFRPSSEMNGSRSDFGSHFAISDAKVAPPAYRPAPDYESAIKQPSLDQYNTILLEQTRQIQMLQSRSNHTNGYGLTYSNSFQCVSNFNGNYDNIAATSNPELNQHPTSHLLKPYRPPPVYSRIFAVSSPDLTSGVISKSMSSPDLLYKHMGPRLHPIDITLENLTTNAVNELTAKRQQQKLLQNNIDEHLPGDLNDTKVNYFQRFNSSGGQNNELAHPARPSINENNKVNTVCDSTMVKADQLSSSPSNGENFHYQTRTNDERLFDMEKSLFDVEYLLNEFKSIPKKLVSAGKSTAEKPEHQDRNRDPQVLPYEETRVSLTPTRQNHFGYINASHMQVTLANTICKYIATQTPMKKTVNDFWQMVWETGANIIAALEQPFDTYLPNTAKNKLKCDDFQVKLQSTNENSNSRLVTSILIIKQTSSGIKRLVYHLHFLEWSKVGLHLDPDSFLLSLDEVKSVQRLVESEMVHKSEDLSRSHSKSNILDRGSNNGSARGSGSWRRRGSPPIAPLSVHKTSLTQKPDSPPVVVHCNSGADKTGVFILTQVMINSLEHNDNLDVPRALMILRQQRMNMVQNFEQYKFVYSCLVNYLKNSRLI